MDVRGEVLGVKKMSSSESSSSSSESSESSIGGCLGGRRWDERLMESAGKVERRVTYPLWHRRAGHPGRRRSPVGGPSGGRRARGLRGVHTCTLRGDAHHLLPGGVVLPLGVGGICIAVCLRGLLEETLDQGGLGHGERRRQGHAARQIRPLHNHAPPSPTPPCSPVSPRPVSSAPAPSRPPSPAAPPSPASHPASTQPPTRPSRARRSSKSSPRAPRPSPPW